MYTAEFINIEDLEYAQYMGMHKGNRIISQEREPDLMSMVSAVFEDVIRAAFCSTNKRILRCEQDGVVRFKEYDIAIHTPKEIFLGEIKTSKRYVETGKAFRQMRSFYLSAIEKSVVFFVVRIPCYFAEDAVQFDGDKVSISEISTGKVFCFTGQSVWDFAIKNGFSKNQSLFERAILQVRENKRVLVSFVDQGNDGGATLLDLPDFKAISESVGKQNAQ